MLSLFLLSGCISALKPGYEQKRVYVRLKTAFPSDYALRVDGDGQLVHVDADGFFVIELPSVPRRCDTYFLTLHFPIRQTPLPELFVLQGGRTVAHTSVAVLHNLARQSGEVVELPVK